MNTKTRIGLLILMLPLAAWADFQVLEIPPLTVGEQLPEGWSGHQPPHLERIEGSHRVIEENGRSILRLKKNKFDSTMLVQTEVDLPPGQNLLELGILSRVPEIELPTELPGRNRFRAGVVFLNERGEEIQGSFPQISIGEEQPEWTLATQEYAIPTGAVKVRLSIQLLNCVGVWDIQSVGLRVKP